LTAISTEGRENELFEGVKKELPDLGGEELCGVEIKRFVFRCERGESLSAEEL